jgi:iron-sulfur cluster repair protein YtfE (RIC family)
MAEQSPIRFDAVAEMAAAHKSFRSSLASAPALIDSAVGDGHRRALIANYYANVLAALEVHHEGEEELLFPLLIERVPELREVVDLGTEQHEQVLPLLAAAKTATATWESSGDSGGPELARALRALDEALSVHLDYEEGTIMPIAAEHISVEEWEMLPRHTMENFTGDKPWLLVGWARENRTPEQWAMMLDRAPPPMRQWWETVGEPSFNALIAELRQTN